jgi:hypothetical protein
MSDLKDYDVKVKAIRFDRDGYSQAKIAELLGIPRSTLGDFLRKESFVSFWAEYDSKDKMIPTSAATPDYEKMTTEFNYKITTSQREKDNCKHFFIPDTQCKSGIDMSYLSWVGNYIVDRKPDVIIHIGDHADMPSLSSYDKGKRSAEGNRVTKDINAAIKGMELLLKPLYDYQQKELKEFGEIKYKPRMILTLGNHEQRIQRHVDANPELYGFLGYDNLLYQEMGWEVYDFLKPVIVNGVTYCHFMANPMSGKPYGGTAQNILQKVGESYSVGHKQTLDVATRFLPASGKQQWGIVAGACYPHNEGYKGHQGNIHWRGIIIKHNVSNGSYNPMFVDLDYLKKKYQ